jgi:hypothetical protein
VIICIFVSILISYNASGTNGSGMVGPGACYLHSHQGLHHPAAGEMQAGVELSDCFVADEALFARPGDGLFAIPMATL